MKSKKIISLVVALTLVMALLTMPAHAALIVDNGAVSTTSATTIGDYDANFGDVVECNKFGAAGIYDMHFKGNAYNGGNVKGPYRMFVSKDFTKISTTDLDEKCFVATSYIAMDGNNYKNATTDKNNEVGIHIGLMADGKAWYCFRNNINLDKFVDGDWIHTDRLAKLDVVVTASETKNKLNFKIYLNNRINSNQDFLIQKSGSAYRTDFTEFVISMQAPYTFIPQPVNIYAGDISCKTVATADWSAPNNGTGTLTADGVLAEYAADFVPGQNFYVPAETTVADILAMTNTYKTFELRSEDGTVITEASEDSALGCYIYCVGNNNNTDDNGVYSKISEDVDTTLVKDADAKTFTASGIAKDKDTTMIVAQFDSTGNTLTKILSVEKISKLGQFDKTYTVADYDENSLYKAFLWKMSDLVPMVESVELN